MNMHVLQNFSRKIDIIIVLWIPLFTVGIRLVDGSAPWEGRLELYRDQQWMTVCDD